MNRQIEEQAIASLQPYERNTRIHSDSQVDLLVRSIQEYGWTVPVLVDEQNVVIAGHGRIEAAKRMGLDKVPTIRLGDLTPEQVRAYRIADNRLTDLGEWDTGLLGQELSALKELDFDLELTGFNLEDLAEMLPSNGGAGSHEEEETPEPPEDPITKPGDIWTLGGHRLICGDCTREDHVRAVMADSWPPDLLLTDPPYCSGGFQESGRSLGSVGRRGTPKNTAAASLANDLLSSRGYQALMKSMLAQSGVTFMYCFTDWRMWLYLFDLAESVGFGIRSMIVWDKTQMGMGKGWRSQHELIMWATGKVAPYGNKWGGAGNVIQAKRTGNDLHTTQKPVDLIEALIQNTPFAKTIYDPFCGSGTTIIAAERQNRRCFAIELDPAYCDVIVERWENYTGGKAKRA